MTIQLAAGSAKVSLEGKIAPDEMSGFHFAEVEDFKIKPLIAVLQQKGQRAQRRANRLLPCPRRGASQASPNLRRPATSTKQVPATHFHKRRLRLATHIETKAFTQ
jgi:hypothetical protein